VTLGDLNGDGCADLILSAYFDGLGISREKAGLVRIIFGRGSVTSCSVTTDFPTDWDLGDILTPADVTIWGANAGDFTGLTVAVGNVDGDGYDDLLLDAERASPSLRLEAGQAWVVFGRDLALWPADLDLAVAGLAARVDGAQPGDLLHVGGASDLNGDGAAEILLVATGANEAYVISGGAGVTETSVFDMASYTPAMTITGPPGGGMTAMAGAGNFNGDLSSGLQPLNDLVLGATGADGNRGATYVIYGAEALPATVDLATTWNVKVSGSAGEMMGAAALLADVSNDGLADLVTTAWMSNLRGKVVVVLGTPFEDGSQVSFTPTAVSPNQASTTILGRAGGNMLGISLGAGHIDGDAVGDLLIGAVFSSGPPALARGYCGETVLVMGTAEP